MLKFVLCLVALAAASAVPIEKSIEHQRMVQYMKNSGQPLDGDFMEDAKLSVMELIAKYGYQGESHTIQTEDGYILTVHRILRNAKCTGDLQPVIVQHGLLSSSADWIIMGPKSGLGYLLSDACFDVWMGNSRGNTNSRGHSSLDPDSDEYWNFSWHEMGIYDLPTLIDYVLAKTGRPNLFYIGHSQGTTQFFILDTLKPEYSSKVKAMFALAPIAFMGNSDSLLLTTISHFQGVLGWVADFLGINEFLPSTDLISDVGGKLCSDEHPDMQNVCSNVLFVLCGYDEPQTNKTMLPVIMGHAPAGSSTKQFLHYAQLMNAGKFQMYDYGNKENNQIYGQKNPPEYPLEKSKTPIALVYSKNDYFANVKDVDTLYTKLHNPLGKFLVAWDMWNHLDYLWGIDVKTLVYDQVLEIMLRY